MILLTLVVTLSVVCGIIAYVGDHLGKRLGKKRVTLMGLRPRQTAVLMSVSTGICIFLVAFASLLLVDKNARHALLTFEQTVKQNRALAQENSSLNTAKSRLAAAKQQLEGDVESVNRQLSEKQKELLSKQAELKAKQAALQRKQAELSKVSQELSKVSFDLRQTEQALNTTAKMVNTTQTQLTETRTNLKTTEADLKKTEVKLVETSKQLTEQEKLLSRGEGVVFEAGRQVLDLEKQRETLRAEVKKLTDEVQQLAQERNVLKTIVEKLIQERVVIASNEVVASRTIRATRSVEQVQEQLAQLLTEANRIAQERGAKSSEEQDRPLMLATRVFVSGETQGLIREDQIMDNAADDIVNSNTSRVVDIVAVRNFVAGEPVQARLVLTPHQVGFGKGESLLSKDINCAQHKAGIFHDILALLDEAQRIAAKQGVRPRADHAYKDGTNEKIFNLLDRLSACSGRIKVNVTAAQDLGTADQLDVQFEVRDEG